MKCPVCKKESSKKNVCTNCGIVFEDRPIDSRPFKRFSGTTREKKYDNNFEFPLAPDISYKHKYPQKARNVELNRALKSQKKESEKTERYYYMKACLYLRVICSGLQLPDVVYKESINIYRCMKEKKKNFYVGYGRKPFFIAFIKIACRMHDYPISNKDLIPYMDYEHKKIKHIGYMEKKFNRGYLSTIETLGLKFKKPEHPRYIDHVCNELKLPYRCAARIHELYEILKKEFRFRIEGYVLALFYLECKKEFKLTLSRLEKEFSVSGLTISARRDEILKLIKKR